VKLALDRARSLLREVCDRIDAPRHLVHGSFPGHADGFLKRARDDVCVSLGGDRLIADESAPRALCLADELPPAPLPDVLIHRVLLDALR
jgi:hypothetical protein